MCCHHGIADLLTPFSGSRKEEGIRHKAVTGIAEVGIVIMAMTMIVNTSHCPCGKIRDVGASWLPDSLSKCHIFNG
jgi:hypothetical protein